MASQTYWLHTKKYTETSEYFYKSTYYPGELKENGTSPGNWKWGEQRLLNEATALQLIRMNTTIPVPTLYSCERDEHGAMHLKVERIHGIVASEAGELCRKPGGQAHVTNGKCIQCEDIAAQNINEFVEGIVVPQLQNLRNNQTGLNGFVLPPPRILEYDTRDEWKPKESSAKNYVFCHGDLARTNIMLDENLNVLAIIDWETAGFYPAKMERPLWQLSYVEYMETYKDTATLDQEIELIT